MTGIVDFLTDASQGERRCPNGVAFYVRPQNDIYGIIMSAFPKPKKGEKKMAHKIAADKCVGCGCCKDACPAEAISEGTPYVIDADKCVDCGACAAQCPNEAIAPA